MASTISIFYLAVGKCIAGAYYVRFQERTIGFSSMEPIWSTEYGMDERTWTNSRRTLLPATSRE